MTPKQAAILAHQEIQREMDLAVEVELREHEKALFTMLDNRQQTIGFVRLCLAMSYAEYMNDKHGQVGSDTYTAVAYEILFQHHLRQNNSPQKSNERKQRA